MAAIWTPFSAQRRCEHEEYDEILEHLWMRRRCVLTLGHEGDHACRWEDKEGTDEDYLEWLRPHHQEEKCEA